VVVVVVGAAVVVVVGATVVVVVGAAVVVVGAIVVVVVVDVVVVAKQLFDVVVVVPVHGPICTPVAPIVSANPAPSVSNTNNGAGGVLKLLCVAQQFAIVSVMPRARPSGVTVKGSDTATAESPLSGTKL
jgi:hypothetical protein